MARATVAAVTAGVFALAAPASAKLPCVADPFAALGKPTMTYRGAQFGHVWNCRAWLSRTSIKAVCTPTGKKAHAARQ